MKLTVKDLSIDLDGFKVKKVSFEVVPHSFFSIVGPTGSGKSSILKAIAGLLEVEGGKIFFGEKNVNSVPAEKREVGFVFQNASLFSHLNVFENIAFGLRVRKEKNVEKKVVELLEMVGLQGFESRSTKNLSGGEAKLVAIARALAVSPKLLALDEPLNGLDAPLREKMKNLIKKIQTQTKITTIYVTHDLDEAFFLSDKILVLNNGQVEQIGEAKEIFLHPKTVFVKDFVSDYALVNARVVKKGGKNVLSAKIEFDSGLEKGNGFLSVKKNSFRKSI